MRDTSVNNGLFIAVEGFDGSGKTTFIKALKTALEAEMSKPDYQGTRKHVTVSKEPAGVYRDILINSFKPDSTEDPVDRMLLAALSRKKSWAQEIRPALIRGDIVLTDRWELSTLITNGLWEGGGKYEAAFYELRQLVQPSVGVPDIYVGLDTPFETCIQRTLDRKERNAFDDNVKDTVSLAKLHWQFQRAFNKPERIRILRNRSEGKGLFVIKNSPYLHISMVTPLIETILSSTR